MAPEPKKQTPQETSRENGLFMDDDDQDIFAGTCMIIGGRGACLMMSLNFLNKQWDILQIIFSSAFVHLYCSKYCVFLHFVVAE